MVRAGTATDGIRSDQPRSSRAQSRGVDRAARPRPSTSLGTSDLETARLWSVLATVPDPEIPVVSIVDLGIVRSADAGARRVGITPTYTGCPATLVIHTDIRIALDKAGFEDVEIVTELAPPWTTDWISEAGAAKLRAYGIAPPRKPGESTVDCPQCGSTATEQISRFGSTPCKALWRCRDCLEPFDLFKCH